MRRVPVKVCEVDGRTIQRAGAAADGTGLGTLLVGGMGVGGAGNQKRCAFSLASILPFSSGTASSASTINAKPLNDLWGTARIREWVNLRVFANQ